MENIDYLYSSNGSGEPPRMTVTVTRAPGATTFTVDSTVNVPSKFVATSGALNTDTNLMDPATILVFRGTKTGSNTIEIDDIAPGYSDTLGTEVGHVIVIKPATYWADMLTGSLTSVKTSLEDIDDSLGGATPVKLVVSATQPPADPDKTVIWFEPV